VEADDQGAWEAFIRSGKWQALKAALSAVSEPVPSAKMNIARRINQRA
jgi:hypothetical protein